MGNTLTYKYQFKDLKKGACGKDNLPPFWINKLKSPTHKHNKRRINICEELVGDRTCPKAIFCTFKGVFSLNLFYENITRIMCSI
jgi:hypothetical protein